MVVQPVLQLDALEDAIRAHTDDVEAQVRAVYTWVAQCTKANYSLADTARDSGKADVATRQDTRIDAALKTLGITPAQLAALQKLAK